MILPGRTSALLLTILLFTSLLGSAAQPDPFPPLPSTQPHEIEMVRIYVTGPSAKARLLMSGVDVLEHAGPGYLAAFVSAEQKAWLAAQGYAFEVDPYGTADAQRLTPELFMDGYRTVDEIEEFLRDTRAAYPHLTELIKYGESWEKVRNPEKGHDLWVMRLTNRSVPPLPDAPGGRKPTFLLMAAIHAREISTPEMAVRFIDYLVTNYGVHPDVTWLLDHQEIWVAPMTNPDGYRHVEQGHLQRKNTNVVDGACAAGVPHIGVDLNRNSSFAWGGSGSSGNPCSQIYRGVSPASEPEVNAIQQLMVSLFPNQRGPGDNDAAPPDTTGVMITLHSYSNLVLYPWGHTAQRAPNYNDLKAFSDKMGQLTGYTSCQPPHCLYSAAGTTDDWAYGELGIAAFTFEIGPTPERECGGFFPAYSCQNRFWNENLPAYLYAARLARAPHAKAHGPDTYQVAVNPVVAPAGSAVLLEATVDDTGNGRRTVVAAEYYLRDPQWLGGESVPMRAADGAFDSPVEQVQGHVDTSTLDPGRYLVYVRGQDAAGHWGPFSATILEVTEASAGDPTPTATATATATPTATITLTPTATSTPRPMRWYFVVVGVDSDRR